MPSVQQLADLVALTQNTFETRGRWESIAQQYPDYLWVQQAFRARRMSRVTSPTIEWALEVAAATSFESSYVNHPLSVSVPDIAQKASVPLIKVRTSVGWTRDERELQGTSIEQLVNVIEMRMAKHERDYIEGMENAFVTKPATSTTFPNELFGLEYWLPTLSGATTLTMNGGGDPAGFTAGAGGITVASVDRWAHAVAGWTAASDDDLFQKLSEFLNRARYFAPVPIPSLTPETPTRQILIQMPLRLVMEELQTAANDNLRNDVGMFRNSLNFRSIPMTVWHAISETGAPNLPTEGRLYVIDWNTFEWVFHSAYDGRVSPPVQDPLVPGAIRQWREVYTQVKCLNREKNAAFNSSASEFIPS